MKKNLLIIALLIVASLFFSTLSNFAALDETGEEIKLYLGETEIVPVSNPTRIAISNPNIVDVVQASKRDITLSPKAVGKTTLVLWDDFGEQSYEVRVLSEDVGYLKRRIDSILEKLNLPGIYTKAEEEQSKVFILGRIKSPKDKEKIDLSLGPLKEKTVDLTTLKEEETAVEIDVQVLELDRGATSTLGFTWPGSINLTEVGSPGLATSTPTQVGTTTTVANIAGGGTTWGSLFKIAKMTRDAYTLKLDTLIQEGKARVLSRPRLTCQSGKEAKLLVGGEVPVLSSTLSMGGAAGGTPAAAPGSIEYKEYGIKLNIKPIVEENNRIHISLQVEVSEVGTAVTTSYALAYPFTKRTASTELYVDDGQTMAIGGLIKQKSEEELRKFPWLADIPILGIFFRQRSITSGDGYSTRGDAELFITLTPKIVSEPKETKEAKKELLRERPAISLMDESRLSSVARYTSVVQKYLLDRLNYPPQARQAGFEGRVKLSLHLSYKGELLDAVIKDSSGYNILDENTIHLAKTVDAYPPFPTTIEQQELWIEVPIVYELE